MFTEKKSRNSRFINNSILDVFHVKEIVWNILSLMEYDTFHEEEFRMSIPAV